MIWRIDRAVTHGEIDNTVEGKTTGQIWLAGHDRPLILSLVGDTWRDLAGTRLRFTNPSPQFRADTQNLADLQLGIVGDMTASLKSKHLNMSLAEFHQMIEAQQDISFEWKNTLSLEWFTETNGRVLIKATTFQLEISPHEWQMDADAEMAQKLANLNAMRGYIAQMLQRDKDPNPTNDFPEILDESGWEEKFKKSERETDAFQEVNEKYMDDPDYSEKQAFVMGWDSLIETMADHENDDDDFFDEFEDEFDDDDMDEFSLDGESDSYEIESEHPLQIQTYQLAMRAMDLMQGEADFGTPAHQLIHSLFYVSGRLANAFNDLDNNLALETEYVLAVLKRGLHRLNDAIGTCQILINSEQDPDQLAALTHLRQSAYEIRHEITKVRSELMEN